MADKQVYGWSNYRTWKTAAEIDNTENLYLERVRIVNESATVEEAAKRLKNAFGFRPGVNWTELAQTWKEESNG